MVRRPGERGLGGGGGGGGGGAVGRRVITGTVFRALGDCLAPIRFQGQPVASALLCRKVPSRMHFWQHARGRSACQPFPRHRSSQRPLPSVTLSACYPGVPGSLNLVTVGGSNPDPVIKSLAYTELQAPSGSDVDQNSTHDSLSRPARRIRLVFTASSGKYRVADHTPSFCRAGGVGHASADTDSPPRTGIVRSKISASRFRAPGVGTRRPRKDARLGPCGKAQIERRRIRACLDPRPGCLLTAPPPRFPAAIKRRGFLQARRHRPIANAAVTPPDHHSPIPSPFPSPSQIPESPFASRPLVV